MSAPFTSTFASAAASSNGSSSANRRDGSGTGDWPRNRPNGATQTFRRPSAQTTSQTRDIPSQNANSAQTPGTYIPPHLNTNHPANIARNGMSGPARYSRDQMFEILQQQKTTNALDRYLPQVVDESWLEFAQENGAVPPTPRGESADQYPGPGVCWKPQPATTPFGMREMTEEEKQLFSTSVNSPIKLSQTPKEAGGVAPIGTRKSSVSGFSTTGSTSRPGTRRRDTSDSFQANGPMSPAENKSFFRGDSNTATPPPALLRRRTDFKDDVPSPIQKESGKDDEEVPSGYGSIKRANGPLSAGLNSPANSPWSTGPGSSAFGSMGTFGSFNAPQSSAAQEKPEQRPGFGSARGSSRFKDLLSKSSTEDIQGAGKDKGAFGVLGKLPEEDPNAARDMLKTRPNRSETNPYEELPNRTGSAALSSQGEATTGDQPGFGSIGRSHGGLNDFTSPTNTNPYQSPHFARDDNQDGEGQALPPFGSARRGLFSEDGGPRSAGAFGGFPGFGGPAGAPNWSSAGLGSGTPARDRSMGFGDPIFSPLTDMQSPGAGLGSGFFGGGFGSVGRNNRLGGMLPGGMEDPMRGDSRNKSRLFDRPDSASHGIRDPFDNGFARASGAFDDGGMSSGHPGNDHSAFAAASAAQQSGEPPATGSGHQSSPASESAQQTPTSGADYQMPAAQQRQMVMPDRMRWIYRDPQGQVQGPWSGLEMHDWFKAGFFTAELLVKKLEDTDFEPLAQLVRRIGNSREPFLVPQIGVPHGPAPTGAQTAWPNAAPPAGTTSNNNNNAQPPFASAFPSFGTTLTAEQQNALERRKQEEQYLMARQKEHLAQQQMMARQQMQGQPHGMHSLQHQPSAHSLHSQPSYSSITSPSAAFHSAALPPGPSQGLPSHAPIGQQPFGRDEELPGYMDRLNLNQRGAVGGSAEGSPGSQQVNQMLQDRSRLQQQPLDTRAHQEAFLGQQGRNERLEEFQELRGQPETGRSGPDNVLAPIGAQRTSEEQVRPSEFKQAPIGQPAQKAAPAQVEQPSLTEQVQWTNAQQQEQPIQAPPVSISPLPAPAAQRNRQHVADALAAESRSQTQTPVETPSMSVAPWAERPVDAPKGPSLREIQEAEAKKAAEQAAILNAARQAQAQAEQDRLAETATVPPAPGLPASATWGTSSSPGTPTGGVGAWAKQPVKPSAATNGPAKKTLAQIQKEEEARKLRANAAAAAQAQAQSASSPVSAAQGKRYAELASKAAPAIPTAPMGNSAWTTVGSGGKVKPPPTILATPQVAPRSVSSTATPIIKSRPSLPATRPSMTGEKTKAQEEFVKWLKGQLGKGLNSSINVDSFVQDLMMLPPEAEIIADSVYANSQTLDGRRIAEEFVRRRKNADKGIVEPVGQSLNGSEIKSTGGGWSEVAKKGPEKKEEPSNAAFKVVAGKKKSKR